MIPKDVVVSVNKPFHFATNDVFDALTWPELIEKWFFPDSNDALVHATINLKVGGRFSVTGETERAGTGLRGKYVEIEQPIHLAFSLEAPQLFTGVSYVSIFIYPKRYGCELSLTQTGVSPETMEATWYLMLQQLENVLADNFEEQVVHSATLEHH